MQEIASYETSEAVFRHAIEVAKREGGSESEHVYDTMAVAQAQSNLGYCLRMRGKYTEAAPLYTEALKVIEDKAPPHDPLLATTINSMQLLMLESDFVGLAMLYRYMGKYELAEPLYIRALNIRRKIYESVSGVHVDIGLYCKDLFQYLRSPVIQQLGLSESRHGKVQSRGRVFNASYQYERIAVRYPSSSAV